MFFDMDTWNDSFKKNKKTHKKRYNPANIRLYRMMFLAALFTLGPSFHISGVEMATRW